MQEGYCRATWKVNGVQLPALPTPVSPQGPLPPVGMGERGVRGSLGSKMKLCIQMGAQLSQFGVNWNTSWPSCISQFSKRNRINRIKHYLGIEELAPTVMEAGEAPQFAIW